MAKKPLLFRGSFPEVPVSKLAVSDNDDGGSSTSAHASGKGLIGTVLEAYNGHLHLQLRPDDIWISILLQFSNYANGRSESLRSKFVSHAGKMGLKVSSIGTLETVDFGALSMAMMNEISNNLKDPTLQEWFLPGFSTTTAADNVTAAATVMATMQQYFSYEFGILCGIPLVTLLGSVEDWKALRSKVDRLEEFNDIFDTLGPWIAVLRAICDNLVESAQTGSLNNLDFWDDIVLVSANEICGGVTYLSGWMSAFNYFDAEGKKVVENVGLFSYLKHLTGFEALPWPQVDMKYVNDNVASCPISINNDEYQAMLFAGQMLFGLRTGVNTAIGNASAPATPSTASTMDVVQPRNDWAIVIYRDIDRRASVANVQREQTLQSNEKAVVNTEL